MLRLAIATALVLVVSPVAAQPTPPTKPAPPATRPAPKPMPAPKPAAKPAACTDLQIEIEKKQGEVDRLEAENARLKATVAAYEAERKKELERIRQEMIRLSQPPLK